MPQRSLTRRSTAHPTARALAGQVCLGRVGHLVQRLAAGTRARADHPYCATHLPVAGGSRGTRIPASPCSQRGAAQAGWYPYRTKSDRKGISSLRRNALISRAERHIARAPAGRPALLSDTSGRRCSHPWRTPILAVAAPEHDGAFPPVAFQANDRGKHPEGFHICMAAANAHGPHTLRVCLTYGRGRLVPTPSWTPC